MSSQKPLPKSHYWNPSGITGTPVRAALRILQFTLAIIIAALYGVDLAQASKVNSSANASWIYAEVAAALAALTCIIHCFVTVKRVLWCLWDFVLVVLWAAQVGVFGGMYLGSDTALSGNISLTGSLVRMKAAIGLGIACMALWALTFVLGMEFCCSARKITRGTERVERKQEVVEMEEGEPLSEEADEVDMEKARLHDAKVL